MITDSSEECSASIFRAKHYRKRKLVLWLQDLGMKLVTKGVTANTLNGKFLANVSQYVWSWNYRVKSMGQDLKVPFRTKALKYSRAIGTQHKKSTPGMISDVKRIVIETPNTSNLKRFRNGRY
jgi:hypothetical protein